MEERKHNGEAHIEDFLLSPKDRVELVLPSGMPVIFKQPTLAFHIALGIVPGRIANALESARLGKISLEEASVVAPDAEELEGRCEVACVHCLVTPKFSFTPGPGEFDVRRMKPTDKMRVYRWAMEAGGGGVDLETFRDQPSGQVPDDGASGEAERKTAEWVPEKPVVGVGN
jgi:hypothetical protein